MNEQVLSGVEEPVSRVSVGRYIAVSTLGIVLVGLVAQMAWCSWNNGKIVAGVSVGRVEIGGLTLDQARQKLNAAEAGMSPGFVVAGKRYSPSLSEIGVRYDTESALSRAYGAGRGGIAPHPEDTDLALSPVVDKKRLASYLAPIAHLGTAPVDARLEVQKGTIAVVPDKPGFSIDTAALEKALRDNLGSVKSQEPVLEPQVLAASIRTPDLTEAQAQAAALMATKITLTDGSTTIVPTPADIAGWLEFVPDQTSGKVMAKVSNTKVVDYVAALAKRIDHPAIDKRVNNINGTQTVVAEGKDGDGIDREAIVQGLMQLVPGTPINIAVTRHVVAFKTTTTFLSDISAGKYIEINLNRQHLWVWDNHQVVFDSPVTSGAVGVGLGTVTGTFHIYSKETNRYLTGRDYRLHVDYWMPFYRDYGLHDAYWRYGRFGGQDYIRAGSHGCVNLPDATAAWIYNWSDVGTTVYIHN